MMKGLFFYISTLILCVDSIAGALAAVDKSDAVDSIYISGEKYTLNNESFTQYSVGEVNGWTLPNPRYTRPIERYNLIATIPVIGDIGQPLIFDVDIKVKGLGFYDSGFRCYLWVADDALQDKGTPPNCDLVDVFDADNEFYFSVSMSVDCIAENTFNLGSNIQNRDALLTPEQALAIEDSVDRTYGVIGNPYNREREVNLLVDGYRDAGGSKCEELRVELSGFPDTEIYQISGDIIIAEPF
ncbi:hypothetical protein [uncultured Microbulbifer sp.]|uniref:hypothetical protein n=1 Tax=uncultured Microbulbifer sp. TaxID=348147 RepID=UPI0026089379|nr:hypothetical protein [uncultured Microbulbifer sp.]